MTRLRKDLLAPRDRQALRFGALVAVPALLLVFVLRPFVAAIGTARDEVGRERAVLAKEQLVLAEAPQMPGAIERAGVTLRQASVRLYPQRDVLSATAMLTRDVTRTFGDAGVVLRQVESRDAVRLPGGLRELTIELRGEGDFEGVLTSVASLEAAPRLLRVAKLGIDRGPVVPGGGGSEALSFVAVVHAYTYGQ
jgi:hypothetical protein